MYVYNYVIMYTCMWPNVRVIPTNVFDQLFRQFVWEANIVRRIITCMCLL